MQFLANGVATFKGTNKMLPPFRMPEPEEGFD
jgi:hypothetical protein